MCSVARGEAEAALGQCWPHSFVKACRRQMQALNSVCQPFMPRCSDASGSEAGTGPQRYPSVSPDCSLRYVVLTTSQGKGPENQLFLPVSHLFSCNQRVKENTRYSHIKGRNGWHMGKNVLLSAVTEVDFSLKVLLFWILPFADSCPTFLNPVFSTCLGYSVGTKERTITVWKAAILSSS